MGAKTISVSDLRRGLADALDMVSGEEIIIITRRGKKDQAIIDLDKLEDLIASNDSNYLAKIKQARSSKEHLSHQDVFGNL